MGRLSTGVGGYPTSGIPPRDPTKWKIRQWEQILPGAGFDRIEAAARILDCASGLAAAMDRIARAENLANQDDYQVLSLLRIAQHTGQQLTVTNIATALETTTAATALRLNRLEARGYARRSQHPTDRRSVHVTITADGAASVERIITTRTHQREQWLAALTHQERSTLTALLTKLGRHSRI